MSDFILPPLLDVGQIRLAQGGGVVESFVTTHEIAEGVADENLANERRVGQPVKHGHRIGHFGVEFPYPAVGDCSRGVDRRAQFLGPPASKMVEHLEG